MRKKRQFPMALLMLAIGLICIFSIEQTLHCLTPKTYHISNYQTFTSTPPAPLEPEELTTLLEGSFTVENGKITIGLITMMKITDL